MYCYFFIVYYKIIKLLHGVGIFYYFTSWYTLYYQFVHFCTLHLFFCTLMGHCAPICTSLGTLFCLALNMIGFCTVHIQYILLFQLDWCSFHCISTSLPLCGSAQVLLTWLALKASLEHSITYVTSPGEHMLKHATLIGRVHVLFVQSWCATELLAIFKRPWTVTVLP